MHPQYTEQMQGLMGSCNRIKFTAMQAKDEETKLATERTTVQSHLESSFQQENFISGQTGDSEEVGRHFSRNNLQEEGIK